MTLGTHYAAKASKRLSICPGRTCGVASEISVGLNDRELGEPPIDPKEDLAARAVVLDLLGRDAL
jgi:hypothetical protein